MWKETINLIQQLLSLTDKTERNRQDITKLQQELREFSRAMEKELQSLRLELT
jgi:hypothetical protein